MIRRFMTEFLEKNAQWLTDPINGFFNTVTKPTTETFLTYKSGVAITPGIIEWGVGLLALLVFGVAGVMGFYVLIDLLGGDWVYKQIAGTPPDRAKKSGIAFVLYVLSVIVIGGMSPISIAERVRDDTSVLFAIFANSLPDVGVDITGFTWGLLHQSPIQEFAIQVGVVLMLTSVLIWKYTDYPTEKVSMGLVVSILIATVVAYITNFQLFPMETRVGFVFQLIVLWGVLTVFALGVNLSGYILLEWLNGAHVQYEPDKPKKRVHVADGFVLMGLLAIMATNLGTLLSWVVYKIWIIGGGMRAIKILAGRPEECYPDPETGNEICEVK